MKNNLIRYLMFHSGNLLRNLRQHDYLHVLRKTTAILAIRPRYPSRIESGSKRRIRKDGKGYPVFQFVTAVLYDHRHVSILCGGEFVIDLVEYI